MGKPSTATSDVPAKSKSPRTSGKIKVSQEPTLGHRPSSLTPMPVVLSHPEPLSSVPALPHPIHSGGTQEENFGPLPTTYHQDTLFLTARDPRWLFSYWDFDWDRIPASEMREGRRTYFLRVMRQGGQVETLVEINPSARNWYVPVSQADTVYSSELGYFDRMGYWQGIVRSREAHTPADTLAQESHNEQFATVPQKLTFAKLQELVQQHMEDGESLLQAITRITGEGHIQMRAGAVPVWSEDQKRLLAMLLGESLVDVIGLGSDEIDRLLRKALQQKLHSEASSGLSGRLGAGFGPSSLNLSSLSSPLGASWSAQPFGVARERGFFMHLNAEVIFYGGTAPDATVTVDGKTIQLQPDGTFRYHFTLPDGDFEIPVSARSADGQEERAGTLSFRRQTRRVGVVDATVQPQHLEPLMGRRSA